MKRLQTSCRCPSGQHIAQLRHFHGHLPGLTDRPIPALYYMKVHRPKPAQRLLLKEFEFILFREPGRHIAAKLARIYRGRNVHKRIAHSVNPLNGKRQKSSAYRHLLARKRYRTVKTLLITGKKCFDIWGQPPVEKAASCAPALFRTNRPLCIPRFFALI